MSNAGASSSLLQDEKNIDALATATAQKRNLDFFIAIKICVFHPPAKRLKIVLIGTNKKGVEDVSCFICHSGLRITHSIDKTIAPHRRSYIGVLSDRYKATDAGAIANLIFML